MKFIVIVFDGFDVVSAHGPFLSYVKAYEEMTRLQRGLDYRVEMIELHAEKEHEGWTIEPDQMIG